MTTYYHGSQHDFPVGHIIKAGGHGDRYRRFMFPQPTHLFENACEIIRSCYFPLKPSRFNCIFSCETHVDLDVFCKKYGGRDHYYAVEAVDPLAFVHRGTWHLPFGNELHGMVNLSWVYWTQAHQDAVEIIIGGGVRVVQKLQ